MKIESLLIHGGIDGDKHTGAVNVPIIKLQLTSNLSLEKIQVMNIQEQEIQQGKL